MLKGFMDAVPRELDEAARLDGAGWLAIFLEMVTVTLAIARSAQEFYVNWPELMGGALIGGTPSIVLYLLMQRWLVRGLTAGAVKR